MIILSSSSRRRKKRKSVFLRGGVVSHYHLSSRIVEHLYHVVQLLLYLPASVLPPFLSFSSNTTPRAARFPRVFQSREKEREREREWKASGFIEGGWSNETSLWTGTA